MTDIKVRILKDDSTPSKIDGVGMVPGPIVEFSCTPPTKESGYARAARMRLAGSQATSSSGVGMVNHSNDEEPYEDTGFGD